MTVTAFRDCLLGVCPNTYHRKAAKASANYLVWGEVGAGGVFGDNTPAEGFLQIAVDYFTKAEYDPVPDQVTAVLEQDEIAVDGPVIDYEADTGVTHYSWICEVERGKF